MWTLRDALDLCQKVEAVAAKHGYHVALTGGCLYKDGYRKDVDLLFYPHKGAGTIEIDTLCGALYAEAGFNQDFEKFSHVIKATYNGKKVDIFITERPDLWGPEPRELLPSVLATIRNGDPYVGGY